MSNSNSEVAKTISFSDLKASVNADWGRIPAGKMALKIIDVVEASHDPEKKWFIGDFLEVLELPELTPDSVAALAILTSSTTSLFMSTASFVDEKGQMHTLSSSDFQKVLDEDSLVHPVTGVIVSKASEHVVPCFLTMDNVVSQHV